MFENVDRDLVPSKNTIGKRRATQPITFFIVRLWSGNRRGGSRQIRHRESKHGSRHRIVRMIERLSTGTPAAHPRVALFDFDGTLSLIRSGWMDVMVPMMVEVLLELKSGESEQELTAIVEEWVWRLTGKQTIHQMITLADEVTKRGGEAKDPLEYKHRYLDLLWQRIEHRVAELDSGDAAPAKYLVPGSIELLDALRTRGVKMYLASGTDEAYMRREADLLGVTKYFDGGVHGAQDDYKTFSKSLLIKRILDSAECEGGEILGFGDGYVEIENVKEVSGTAVGVATDEPDCKVMNEWKRQRLAGVGADYIVPNFLDHDELLETLFSQ
jgi:phosphoglycolate phosphatase-like HAD superfamily hydrolase